MPSLRDLTDQQLIDLYPKKRVSSPLDLSQLTDDELIAYGEQEEAKAQAKIELEQPVEPKLGILDRLINVLNIPQQVGVFKPAEAAVKREPGKLLEGLKYIPQALSGLVTGKQPETKADFRRDILTPAGVPESFGSVTVPAYAKPQGINLLKALLFPSTAKETFQEAVQPSQYDLLELIGNIGLDPLTYVTGGTRVAPQIAGQTLSRAGVKALKARGKTGSEEIKNLLAAKGITKTEAELATAGKIRAERALSKGGLPKEYIDRGGLKLFGETLVKPETFKTIPELIRRLPGVERARNILGPLFSRDFRLGAEPLKTKEAFRDFYNKVGYTKEAVVEKVINSVEIPAKVKKGVAIPARFPTQEEFESMFWTMSQATDESRALIGKKLAQIGANKKQISQIQNDIQRLVDGVDNPDIPVTELKFLKAQVVRHNDLLKKAEIPSEEFDAIRKERIAKLPQELHGPAQNLFAIMRQEAKKDVRYGLLNRVLPNYIPRKYVDLDLVSKGPKPGVGGVMPSTLGGFARRRKIDTIEEAAEFAAEHGGDLVQDPAALIAERAFRGGKARATLDLEARLKQIYKGDIPPIVEQHIKTIKTPNLFSPEIRAVLQTYDKALNFYKGMLTGPFPPFHLRNTITNKGLSFLGIGSEALNPANWNEARKIRQGAEGTLKTVLGEEIPYTLIKEQAAKNGVTRGFFVGDLTETIPRKLQRGLQTKLKDIAMHPLEVGRKVGQFIENGDRLALYSALLRKGLDFKSAAKQVDRILFDYSNLAPFEQQVMKRIFPFYTFKRKSLEFFVGELVKHPGRFENLNDLKDFFDQSEITPEEAAKLPPWLQNRILIKTGKDQYLTGLEIGWENIIENIARPSSLLAEISPIAKIPLEQAFDKDVFRNKSLTEAAYNITDIPEFFMRSKLGKMVGFKQVLGGRDGREFKWINTNPRALEVLRNLPTSRFMSTAATSTKGEDVFNTISKKLTGFKLTEVDPELAEYLRSKGREEDLVKEGAGRYFKRFFVPKTKVKE